jgi:hypothetical protein
LREYKEKFVAVWNQRVIDEDTDLERLSKKVKEKTTGAKGVYIAYVSEKPVEMILRFPSILGRDVINRFRMIFDRAEGELLLTKEEKTYKPHDEERRKDLGVEILI